MTDIREALSKIEKWLGDAPTHPQVQYLMEYDGADPECMTGVEPTVVDTWNKDAMMSEWHDLRARIAIDFPSEEDAKHDEPN